MTAGWFALDISVYVGSAYMDGNLFAFFPGTLKTTTMVNRSLRLKKSLDYIFLFMGLFYF